MAAYVNAFKLATISYALVAIGDTDFRNEAFLETEGKLSNGTPIKLPRAQALQKLIQKWSPIVINGAYLKYYQLLDEIERETENVIVFEPMDVTAEIARLEKRVEELKKMETPKATATTFSAEVKAVAAATRASTDEPVAETTEVLPEQPEAPVEPPKPVPGAVRQPITPQQAAPPVSAEQRRALQGARAEKIDLLPDVYDSFADSSDMEAEVDRENARLIAQRRAVRAGQMLPNTSSVPTIQRRPRNADAVGAENLASPEVFGLPSRTNQMVKAGELNGVDVFRLPTEELTSRGGTPPLVDQRIELNKSPAGQANPRFRPSKP
jgi:hypothetical protein